MMIGWQNKAKVMRVCARIPGGDRVYKLIQKKVGRLNAKPMARVPHWIEMARWILNIGSEVKGKIFFEVGTGHCPVVPIGFFLCGAEKVITVDLNKRLDIGILRKSLVWMVENRNELFGYCDEVAERADFDERMDLIERLNHNPKKLLSKANIVYIAPADASDMRLPDASVDYHTSTTVFEHIPKVDIKKILEEAKRILKKDGTAIHFIDLSDHFQHQDPSISKINFLRFSVPEWQRIAGNEFAYCNRLRASEYKHIFEGLGFSVRRQEYEQDHKALAELRENASFRINPLFEQFTTEDLCTVSLRVLLEKS